MSWNYNIASSIYQNQTPTRTLWKSQTPNIEHVLNKKVDPIFLWKDSLDMQNLKTKLWNKSKLTKHRPQIFSL